MQPCFYIRREQQWTECSSLFVDDGNTPRHRFVGVFAFNKSQFGLRAFYFYVGPLRVGANFVTMTQPTRAPKKYSPTVQYFYIHKIASQIERKAAAIQTKKKSWKGIVLHRALYCTILFVVKEKRNQREAACMCDQ